MKENGFKIVVGVNGVTVVRKNLYLKQKCILCFQRVKKKKMKDS